MSKSRDRFYEALGPNVGPATRDEVVRALGDHGGEVVVRLTDAEGQLIWHKHGRLDRIEGGEESAFVVVRADEQEAGDPLIYVDPPLVVSFSRDERRAERLDADQHVGGVRLRLGFGPFEGHTLEIVFWHGIQQLTESGDVAPGFGEVETNVEEG